MYVNPLVQPTLSRYVYMTERNVTSQSTIPVTVPPASLSSRGIYYIGVRPLTLETGEGVLCEEVV